MQAIDLETWKPEPLSLHIIPPPAPFNGKTALRWIAEESARRSGAG